jgi:hypothetical protein
MVLFVLTFVETFQIRLYFDAVLHLLILMLSSILRSSYQLSPLQSRLVTAAFTAAVAVNRAVIGKSTPAVTKEDRFRYIASWRELHRLHVSEL